MNLIAIHVTNCDCCCSIYLGAEIARIVEGGQSGNFTRGEVTGDQHLDLSDAVSLLWHLFLGGPSPECLDAADVDDDGALQITDAVCLLSHLFLGGAPPREPFKSCGPDLTPDALDCRRFAPCPQGGGISVKVIGLTVDESGKGLSGVSVSVGTGTSLSDSKGFFSLDANLPSCARFPLEIPMKVLTRRDDLSGFKDAVFDPASPTNLVDVGAVILSPPPPAECANAVGRAAERGCGRVFVWGIDEPLHSYQPEHDPSGRA
jgi:hypothetical protein